MRKFSDISALVSNLVTSGTPKMFPIIFLLLGFASGLFLEDSNIAFQTYGHLGQSSTNGALTFSSIHLNAGNAYDLATGTFTAPVSGTYLFMVQVEVTKPSTTQAVYIHIIQSGKIISSGYVETDPNIDDGMATASAITSLSRGEKVWVTASASFTSYSNLQLQNSHFSGALLSV